MGRIEHLPTPPSKPTEACSAEDLVYRIVYRFDLGPHQQRAMIRDIMALISRIGGAS